MKAAFSSPGRPAGDLKHPAVKAAAYAYLATKATSCRPREKIAWPLAPPGKPEEGGHQGHTMLVHQLQSVDPEDPWLQREWGRVRKKE